MQIKTIGSTARRVVTGMVEMATMMAAGLLGYQMMSHPSLMLRRGRSDIKIRPMKGQHHFILKSSKMKGGMILQEIFVQKLTKTIRCRKKN
jgi:hypothetical protein